MIRTPASPERPDEGDPTGVRALLSGLSDPGPMPPDLVDRIRASIAEEQSARAGTAAHARAAGAAVVGVHPAGRRRWNRGVLVAAACAAAIAALGGPALLSAGRDDVTASSGAANDSAGASSSAQGLEPPIASFSPAVPAPPATTKAGERAVRATGPVTMVATGTEYTSSQLATQARTMLLRPVTGSSRTDPGRTRAEDATGLRGCLTAMGVPSWQPVVGDVATFEGARAVVAVVSSDTGQDVYAVPTWCDAGHPKSLAGPLPIR